jgi:hypothetical protein
MTIILNMGLSIPGPETLTSLYNICLQPAVAINDSKLCAPKKTLYCILQFRVKAEVQSTVGVGG